MNETILPLEDDSSLMDDLTYVLQGSGFRPGVVRTMEEINAPLAREHYGLLLLDMALPDGTGFDVCRNVRGRDSRTPVLFLTASDERVHAIRGLDCGKSDYITRSFRLGGLCSCTHAQLRRTSLTSQDTASAFACGDLTIGYLNHRAVLKDVSLELTGTEYKLLSLLVQNAGQTLTRDMVSDKLWGGTGKYVDNNTLSVYTRQLREKVEAEPSALGHLIAVRGFGYQWKERSL